MKFVNYNFQFIIIINLLLKINLYLIKNISSKILFILKLIVKYKYLTIFIIIVILQI